jgi:MFS transporter, DHA1 family, multidrug resistance protein
MTVSSDAATGTSYREILKSEPALAIIMVTVAGHMLMMGSLAPVLSLYAKTFGVSEWAAGLVITIFGLGRLAVDIPAGLFADKMGRATLLWLGPAIAAAASLGAALADDYTLLIAFRFLQGVGSGIYMTVASIVCADPSTPRTRGRIMALYQAAILAGAGLGPAIGGMLAESFGYRAPFWLSLGIGVAAALCARFLYVEKPRARPAGHGDHGLSALWAVIVIAPLAVVLLINFGVFFTRSGGQWSMLPLLGHERFGLAPGDIGLALTLSALANLAVLPFAGTAADRFGRTPVIVLSTALCAASLLLIAVAPSPWLYWTGFALLGAATGFNAPAIAAYAIDHAPGGRYGATMGVMRFAGDVGFVAGPVLLGLAVDVLRVGYGGAVAINAALVGVSALAFLLVAREARRPVPPPDDIPLGGK